MITPHINLESTILQATWHKASREIANYAALLIPWEGRIKNIENYYGSVVASYFTFLRWIFWVNLIITALIGGFIVAPEVMFGPDMGTVDYKSVPGSYIRHLCNKLVLSAMLGLLIANVATNIPK